ncbi:MAG: NAD(P)/FAD-dependent oxidoreductase, partial [Verrucomicrobiales bacterium]|nr:NAD(P)/FAD-dependent oxidoreductase [Verrucomicrobiales bacterium]
MMEKEVDVLILGGSFSGASAGMLLQRWHPGAKVLVVERSGEFDRKVGESTSEVAGCFLTRVLGLSGYLSRNHITKHGLRMWFNGGGNECFSQCTEIGPRYQVRLPTYQLDRSELDEYLIGQAEASGCEVMRPATVRDLQLGGEGENSAVVKAAGGEEISVKARWVIDASGKAAVVARQRKTWRRLEGHPTNSVWARFKNVGDLDSAELWEKFPCYKNAAESPRGAATNHLMGYGWWCWIIPLKNGDVSAGLTWNPDLFDLPRGGSLSERLQAHLVQHPVGKELFGDATPLEKDTRTYSHLPYFSTEVAGDGWAAVGDACGFMDPLYSQGLDYCSHTTYAVARMVATSLGGGCVKAASDRYRMQFKESYFRWYGALYRGKYEYLGDAELMHAAFLLDVGSYFMGPVRLVYEEEEKEYLTLPYNGQGGRLFAGFM